MSRLRLVLVRHGVTDWNREGRFQGHRDPGLSHAGRHEAELAAARIAEDERLRPTRVMCSSLGRALATAQPIAEATGCTIERDDRLIEIGQGEWEGRTHAELEVDDAERYLAWRRATGIRQPPGGEPIEAATDRVQRFVAELEASDDGTVCIVSHGGTLRILAHLLLALDDVHVLEVDNASIGLALRDDRRGPWRLERWNDTLHLLGREPTHVDELEGRPLAL